MNVSNSRSGNEPNSMRRQVFASPLISNKFNLITLKKFKNNQILDKATIVERMKLLLGENGGLMMDVKLNFVGDLLCYVVLSGDNFFDLEEEFREKVIPEMKHTNVSFISLGPKKDYYTDEENEDN